MCQPSSAVAAARADAALRRRRQRGAHKLVRNPAHARRPGADQRAASLLSLLLGAHRRGTFLGLSATHGRSRAGGVLVVALLVALLAARRSGASAQK